MQYHQRSAEGEIKQAPEHLNVQRLAADTGEENGLLEEPYGGRHVRD